MYLYILCVFVRAAGGRSSEPAGRVVKCLWRKAKHFLFEVGSLHWQLPEGRTRSGQVAAPTDRNTRRTECHPSSTPSWEALLKKQALVLQKNKKGSWVSPQWKCDCRSCASEAPSRSITKLWCLLRRSYLWANRPTGPWYHSSTSKVRLCLAGLAGCRILTRILADLWSLSWVLPCSVHVCMSQHQLGCHASYEQHPPVNLQPALSTWLVVHTVASFDPGATSLQDVNLLLGSSR